MSPPARAPLSRLRTIHHAVAAIHAGSASALGIARRSAGAAARGAVAITFDDGPHPEGTPAVLDLLGAYGASATFFVVGEQACRRPELLLRMRAEGHTVALHGDRHLLQTRRRAAALGEDYRRGISAIGEIIGEMPRLHRPPYGIYSPAGLEWARGLGLTPQLWSTWGKDWRAHTTPARIARNALSGIGARAGEPITAGDVILLHDADFYSSDKSHRRTAAALAIILRRLDELGLASATL